MALNQTLEAVRARCFGALVPWCFVSKPNEPHAYLTTRWRWERNTNELREQPRWLEHIAPSSRNWFSRTLETLSLSLSGLAVPGPRPKWSYWELLELNGL